MEPEPGTERTDADLEACKPTFLVRASGGLLMVAGLFQGVLALQTWTIVALRGVAAAAPYWMLVCFVGAIALGFPLMRQKGWAAIGATALAGAMTLVSGAWMLFSILHGLVSLVALGVVPLALAACVMAALAIGPSRRADEARARLREQGLEVGT